MKGHLISYSDWKFLCSILLPNQLILGILVIRGKASIVSHVRRSKVANSFPLSYYRVSSSIKSYTLISLDGAFKKTRVWGSQEWVSTNIFQPSAIFHREPAWMMSLDANREHHTNYGLLPNSVSKKEQFGKYLTLYTL